MAPARLDHAHLRIGEKMDRLPQKIGLRDKVGVQEYKQNHSQRTQARSPGARFEPSAIDAVDQLDIEPPLLQILHAGGGQFARVVGGIVQNLDLQQFPRIIDLAD